MRKILIPCLLLISHLAAAQYSLSRGSRKSDYTYLYKISNKEALPLYRQQARQLQEKLLHTLVDSFLTVGGRVPEHLPPGNYLKVYADRNTLQMALLPIGNVYPEVLNNHRDLAVLLQNEKGEVLSDATVQLGHHRLAYDAATSTFRSDKNKRKGLLQVYYKDVLNGFNLEKQRTWYTRSAWNKFKYAFPVKYITRLVQRISTGEKLYYHSRPAYASRFSGFLVCSKPRYKPGDTVQLKAFVITAGGKPVDEPLLLRLQGGRTDTVLTTLTPYRPGGYSYRFTLTDSLDLRLDDRYQLTLEKPSQKPAEKSVLIAGHFKLEAYELKSITFLARGDKKIHSRGEAAAIYVKASDENDLAVMDGRVKIWILANQVQQYHHPAVFVPDTLWYHTQEMEALGETRILIPDSIFPAANLQYKMRCQFLNSNNESHERAFTQQYLYEPGRTSFTLKADSLLLSYIQLGKAQPAKGMLYAYNQYEDTLQAVALALPAAVKLHPFASSYELVVNDTKGTYAFEEESSRIEGQGYRNKDSVQIQVANPRDLPFWYTIFAGNKVVHRGYGRQLYWESKSITPQHYFVSLQYIWKGEPRSEEFTIPYAEKQLQISVQAPEFVYPGQRVQIGITVNDADGQPVADADVTAYAFTRKFTDASVPVVPFLGKKYPGRKTYGTFKTSPVELLSDAPLLNWSRWGIPMRLTGKAYYRFLHPAGVYEYTEPASDSLTQIAPYVVQNGVLQQVHLLYIDEVPVFFSQARQERRYAFAVSPGKHSLRIRTFNREMKVDSIQVQEGVKHFFSFNASEPAPQVQVKKMTNALTKEEQRLLGRYMMQVDHYNQDNYTYITQGTNTYWLKERGTLLVGPVNSSPASYKVMDGFTQDFKPAPGGAFDIRQGLIRQRPPGKRPPFGSLLGAYTMPDHLTDSVLTEKEMATAWKTYQDNWLLQNNTDREYPVAHSSRARLQLKFPEDTITGWGNIKQLFIFRYDDALYLKTLSGNYISQTSLDPGMYRLLVLLKDDRYILHDSIAVQENGINYYALPPGKVTDRDSMSAAMAAILFRARWENNHNKPGPVIADINKAFNQQYFDENSLTRTVSGYITDRQGTPLPGVTVQLKGTSRGTATNMDGRFTLRVPEKGVLRIAYIGFIGQDMVLNENQYYTCMLKESNANLEEVVVVGYGMRSKQNLAGSVATVSSLSGKVAGVMVRGTGTLQREAPLIIIDGIPFNDSIDGVDPKTINNMTVLNASDAVAIYGARAAAGVILITTNRAVADSKNKQMDIASGQLSLRQNFRDDAFWQPQLRTGQDGKTSFGVTFPDDITNWRTMVVGMTGNKQSGFAETQIKSFKAFTATLGLPAFALPGDTINVIGKTMNYTTDSITATRVFAVNDSIYRKGSIGVKNAWIDTLAVVAGGRDSLSFRYVVQKPDGYYDGEERRIPVFKQGVLETDGFFAALRKDTAFRVPLPESREPFTIYAETAVLPVLVAEMKSIQRYEYLCNEQLASKLMAYLMEEKVAGYLQQPFKGAKAIRELVRQLQQSGHKSGRWGWWPDNAPVAWISSHVITALLKAEAQGYKVQLNKQQLINDALFELEGGGRNVDTLSLLDMLHQLEATVNYQKYATGLQKHNTLSRYNHLRLVQLQQRLSLPVNVDNIAEKPRYTMFGNMYWGEESYRFFDNSIQVTLLMYKILRAQGGQEATLEKIRGYFLEQRQSGHWRNTYESVLILETILPDLLASQQASPASLTITGDTTLVITSFPYTTTLPATAGIQLHKQGGMPVYFTAYRQRWNTSPKKEAHQFQVRTWFASGDKTVTSLKAGTAITLKAAVTVEADADYVMIEIPIPAGCSYQHKNTSWYNHEVHREYFKQKVSIFCSSLKKGTYTFEVSLMPRYTGQYLLNPAKVEMMYFPVFYGREEMKRVAVSY
ncbi:alpha-2-macroglobulin family protein [Chitinophaga defluvii]|uniref:Alpha-2-macroglobulin family protein n=1 Tax=Chitinophaga defluvii TaxID=3163343 RepID=A0ABV2TAS9_9BACT